MNAPNTNLPSTPDAATALRDLPRDELEKYASNLGLDVNEKDSVETITSNIRTRQELLLGLKQEDLLEVVVWARRPVRKSASKEELCREIARIDRTNYDSLSHRGLVTLARIRGIPADATENSHDLIDRLRHGEGFWHWVKKKRRSLVGGMIAKWIEGESTEPEGDYQFLPEQEVSQPIQPRGSLRTHIEELGIVGGIATRIRGVADDYIKQKLDEIEIRIDTKMDQIDKRLAEWRDREVANRLKILRITLIVSVLVAILSLGYKLLSKQVDSPATHGPPAAARPQ